MTNITAMQADVHEAPGRLSNRLMHLAHEASAALTRHKRASVEAAQAHLDAGDILIEAKAHCQHGEWQTFLKTANIAERTARRAMRLARSVLDADAIAETGGVKAALEISGEVQNGHRDRSADSSRASPGHASRAPARASCQTPGRGTLHRLRRSFRRLRAMPPSSRGGLSGECKTPRTSACGRGHRPPPPASRSRRVRRTAFTR